MPSIQIPSAVAALTADGDTTGYATVADNAPFYTGAEVFLNDNAGLSRRYYVTALVGTTKIGLRLIPDSAYGGAKAGPQYGRSDLSAFLAANSAQISQDRQLAEVEPNAIQKLLNIH